MNTAGYDVVSAFLAQEIWNELLYQREQGIAATRVDTVGHSMGGVIVKWYASDMGIQLELRRNGFDPLSWNGVVFKYRRADNFGVGDIRRVVTVGSPFRGSIIADAVSNLHKRAGSLLKLKDLLKFEPQDINALDDLGTGSRATQMLSECHPSLSWFPVVGRGDPLTEEAMFENHRFLYILLGVLDCLPSRIDPPEGQPEQKPPDGKNWLGPNTSDFVVDQWSQVDRPPSGGGPARAGPVFGVTHASEMRDGLDFPAEPPGVASWVAGVLDMWFAGPNEPGYVEGYTLTNSGF